MAYNNINHRTVNYLDIGGIYPSLEEEKKITKQIKDISNKETQIKNFKNSSSEYIYAYSMPRFISTENPKLIVADWKEHMPNSKILIPPFRNVRYSSDNGNWLMFVGFKYSIKEEKLIPFDEEEYGIKFD
jgi:hypothetical protein